MALARPTSAAMADSADLRAVLADLGRQEAARTAVVTYRSDMRGSARWLKDATGEDFAAAAIAPADVRDGKDFLQATRGRARATINRRPAARRKLLQWAVGEGRVTEPPTTSIKGSRASRASPGPGEARRRSPDPRGREG